MASILMKGLHIAGEVVKEISKAPWEHDASHMWDRIGEIAEGGDRVVSRGVTYARDVHLGETSITIHDNSSMATLLKDRPLCGLPLVAYDLDQAIAHGAVGSSASNECGDCLRLCGSMGCQTLIIVDTITSHPMHLDISDSVASGVVGTEEPVYAGLTVTKVDKSQCRDLWSHGVENYSPQTQNSTGNDTSEAKGTAKQDEKNATVEGVSKSHHPANVSRTFVPERKVFAPSAPLVLAPCFHSNSQDDQDAVSSSASRMQACGLALVMAAAGMIILL